MSLIYGDNFKNNNEFPLPPDPDIDSNEKIFAYFFKNCNVKSAEHLILPANVLYREEYWQMFKGCSSLEIAPKLPATDLAYYCYYMMFDGCTSLVTPPELPATIVDYKCYSNMFAGCTSLESLPKLPATVLGEECYSGMFAGCTKIKLSLTQDSTYKNEYMIPINGNGIDASDALKNMFSNTGGTFTGTPGINTTYYTSNEVI